MYKLIAVAIAVALLPRAASADEPAKRAEPAEGGDKLMSGMSIVGNDEAPKSLVIVPWKSSELAADLDITHGLDDSRQPVDPDVFRRELDFYQIRVGAGAPSGTPVP